MVEAVAILTNEQWNLSTLFVVSHFLSTKVSPERKLEPGLRTQKKCPFRLSRGSLQYR